MIAASFAPVTGVAGPIAIVEPEAVVIMGLLHMKKAPDRGC
jgi:hypothetical protein